MQSQIKKNARAYDPICAAIMQHLFDTLSQQYICTNGSDYVDCSFLNYGNAIEILSKKDLRDRTIVMPPRRLFILCQPLFGWSKNDGDCASGREAVEADPLVRIVLTKGLLHIKSLLQHSVDIAEPNFASLTDLIQCKLQMVFMGDIEPWI